MTTKNLHGQVASWSFLYCNCSLLWCHVFGILVIKFGTMCDFLVLHRFSPLVLNAFGALTHTESFSCTGNLKDCIQSWGVYLVYCFNLGRTLISIKCLVAILSPAICHQDDAIHSYLWLVFWICEITNSNWDDQMSLTLSERLLFTRFSGMVERYFGSVRAFL